MRIDGQIELLEAHTQIFSNDDRSYRPQYGTLYSRHSHTGDTKDAPLRKVSVKAHFQ